MPSGAKRRKAAKKKKENIAHIIENQPGNGDSSRSHDEKDSDSSSVSSPRNPLMKNEQSDDDKSDDGRDRDVSTGGSASDEPRDKEKSQFEEVEVTKEVDFESKIVNIDDVKESSGEDLKEGSNSNGEIEKKIEVVVPKQIEDLNESKEVEVEVEKAESPVLSVIEPPSKEVVEVVSQPEVVTEGVEIDLVEKIRGSSVIDAQCDDRELPQSNGTSVDTVNGNGDTVQSRISTDSDNEKKDIFPVPPTVQPTSWKSCCGLFDVFGGSSR